MQSLLCHETETICLTEYGLHFLYTVRAILTYAAWLHLPRSSVNRTSRLQNAQKTLLTKGPGIQLQIATCPSNKLSSPPKNASTHELCDDRRQSAHSIATGRPAMRTGERQNWHRSSGSLSTMPARFAKHCYHICFSFTMSCGTTSLAYRGLAGMTPVDGQITLTTSK